MSGRASYLGRSRTKPFSVTVTDDERAGIQRRAKAAGLSVASFMRAASLGKDITSRADHVAVAEMVSIAGAQQRLADMLNGWLTGDGRPVLADAEVRRIIAAIEGLQGKLADMVRLTCSRST